MPSTTQKMFLATSSCVATLGSHSQYTEVPVKTLLKWSKIFFRSALNYYSRSAERCVEMGVSRPAILNRFRYFWNSNRGPPQTLTIMNGAYSWRLKHLALGVCFLAGCPRHPSRQCRKKDLKSYSRHSAAGFYSASLLSVQLPRHSWSCAAVMFNFKGWSNIPELDREPLR